MAGHARLSASQTKQWAVCPGSVAFMERHPELRKPSDQYAQLGTAAHTLSERCLKEGSEPSDYRGRLIEIIDEDSTSILKPGARWPTVPSDRIVYEVDADMVEAVECMTTYVRNQCVELGLVYGTGLSREVLAREVADLVKHGIVRLENHVIPLPERDDTGGTGDVIIDAWPDLLEVVDYKHGAGVFVPIDQNEQLRSYGLGALQEAGSADYDRVRYTICQPRHMQSPQDGIMSEEMTVTKLLAWKVWLAERAEVVDEARVLAQANATLKDLHEAGFVSTGKDGAHCRFCDLLTDCPAALARAQELAATDFEDMEPVEIETAADGGYLAIMVPWVPFLDKWLKAMMTKAESILMAGGLVEGQKIVRKRSSGRKWITTRRIAPEEEGGEPTFENVTEAHIVQKLVELGVAKADCYTQPSLLTGPQAEKLINKSLRQEFEDGFMYKPEGGLTMAPEDDKRPAVTIDPASDFDGLEE